jgi:hypothetical protein
MTMKNRKFKKVVPAMDFYRTYLDVINGLLRLTEKEKDVLSWFMEREYFYNTNRVNKNVFDKANRKLAAEQLGVSIYYLNNYIKSLKDKTMIVRDDIRGLELNSRVYIDKNDGARIQFEIGAVEG